MPRYTKQDKDGKYYIESVNGKLESNIKGHTYGEAIDRFAEYENADVVPRAELELNEKAYESLNELYDNDTNELSENIQRLIAEVEELQNQLNDYKRVCGELRFTENGNAIFLVGEDVEYVPSKLANGLKNMAVKQAEQELTKQIFKEMNDLVYNHYSDEFGEFEGWYLKLEKKYIGEKDDERTR